VPRRRLTRRSKVLSAAAVVVAAAGVTGGGLATGAFARGKTIVQDPVSSPPVTTASFSFHLSVTGLTKHGGAIAVTGTGQADFTDDAVSAAVTLPPAVAALLPGGSASPAVVDAVLSGGTVYAEVPGLSALVGEPWISVALPSSLASGVPGAFTEVAAALGDVNDILSLARSSHARVVSLGVSTVDGEQVTGFGVAGRVDGVRLTATLWADGSGRLRRATVEVGRSAATGGLGIAGTVDLADYGAPVTVTVPPPAQVKAVPLSLVEQFLGSVLKAHMGSTHAHAA